MCFQMVDDAIDVPIFVPLPSSQHCLYSAYLHKSVRGSDWNHLYLHSGTVSRRPCKYWCA